jgi:hypothetical protein
MPDGSFFTRTEQRPVHYLDRSGAWQTIDTRLARAAAGGWENRANSYGVTIPRSLDDAPIRLSADAGWVAFQLTGSQAAGTVAGSTATFAEALPGVTAAWTVRAGALKEDLVLRDAQATTRFAFDVTASPGLALRETRAGGVAVIDAKGGRAFAFAAPFAVDARGRRAPREAVALSLARGGGGGTLVLTVDRGWLADPARAFPVTVDPTVTVEDPDVNVACLYEYYGANFSCPDSDLSVGKSYTADYRSLLRFNLSAIPAGAHVERAQIRLYETAEEINGAHLPVNVYRVTSDFSNPTWNDRVVPEWSGDPTIPWDQAGGDFAPTVEDTATAPGVGNWIEFTLTDLVERWVQGDVANQGVILWDGKYYGNPPSSSVEFAASDYPSNHGPELEITWQMPPNVSLSGSLWDERDVILDDDRADAGYLDANASLHVSATAGSTGAGLASIEMRVDGVRLRPEHMVLTCCAATASADFVFHRDDVAAGEHAIRVYVRDAQAPSDSTTPGAHVAVRDFVVSAGDVVSVDDGDYEDVPPPGSGAPAEPSRGVAAPSLLSATAATSTRSLIASEAARPGSDLAELLGDAAYTVKELGVMSQGTDASGEPRVVGSVAILRLAQPRAVEATIGCYRARPGSGAIVPYRARVRASALRDLLVRIDLDKSTILCASPGPASEADVQAVPGQPPLPDASED